MLGVREESATTDCSKYLFQFNTVVNKQHVRIWGIERASENCSSYVLICFIKRRTIALYVLRMRNYWFELWIRGISFSVFKFIILGEDKNVLQEAAALHYSSWIRAYLNTESVKNCIGRDRPAVWLARSHDLTPCGFEVSKNRSHNFFPRRNIEL